MISSNITANFQLEYGDFRLDVDLTFPGSGISVLFGESGSGKTTILRCMAGLEQAKFGYFAVNGQVWLDTTKQLFFPPYQRNLGYVFQEANLFTHLTVRENLEFGLKRIAIRKFNFPSIFPSRLVSNDVRNSVKLSAHKDGKYCHSIHTSKGALASLKTGFGRAEDNYHTIIDLLGIDHLLDRMPDRLSGGERQRVAIARALMLNPDILLMDEPLASLDLKRKQEVMPYLFKLQQSFAMPIVYVTHSRQEVMQLADYLIVLAGGKVQSAGILSEMLGRLDSPLAHDKDAASVWQGEIVSKDDAYQLTNVRFSGVTLSLPNMGKPDGNRVRVQIHARDVSLVLEKPVHTSILNVLPATVTGLADDSGGHTIVRLACGGEILLAHITRKSANLLGLHSGMPVFAQIKGTSLLM